MLVFRYGILKISINRFTGFNIVGMFDIFCNGDVFDMIDKLIFLGTGYDDVKYRKIEFIRIIDNIVRLLH